MRLRTNFSLKSTDTKRSEDIQFVFEELRECKFRKI